MGKVAILLCTYNGEKYIKNLLDSILNQSYSDWHLYIHDDGSKDETLRIITEYENNYENISIVPSTHHMGAKNGFGYLLNNVIADYYMFCDQDDVWFTNKIRDSIDFIKHLEFKKSVPVAIGTDLTVTDSRLNIQAESLFSYANVDIEWFKRDRKYIYIANPFVGCTLTINKALRELCGKMPKEAIMHDWWIAQIAYKNGFIDLMVKPTIYYRQHEDNVVGTKGLNTHSINYWISKIKNIKEFYRNQKSIYHMSKLNGCTLTEFIRLKIIQLYRKLK